MKSFFKVVLPFVLILLSGCEPIVWKNHLDGTVVGCDMDGTVLDPTDSRCRNLVNRGFYQVHYTDPEWTTEDLRRWYVRRERNGR